MSLSLSLAIIVEDERVSGHRSFFSAFCPFSVFRDYTIVCFFFSAFSLGTNII